MSFWRRKARSGRDWDDENPSCLGNILVDMGVLSQLELKHALYAQEKQRAASRLGIMLIDQNIISEVDLKRAMKIQERLRSGKPRERVLGRADLAIYCSDAVQRDASDIMDRVGRLSGYHAHERTVEAELMFATAGAFDTNHKDD